MDVSTKSSKRNSKEAQDKRHNSQEESNGLPSTEKTVPYKREPALKEVPEIIEDCHKVADKFDIKGIGELPCPVPPEVEL